MLIKTKVFIGGLEPNTDPLLYGNALAQDFITMAQLHPKLLDTYFIGESSLSWISLYHVEQANIMLKVGLEPRPDQWIIPFFLGFNEFFYLNHNHQAIQYLNIAYEQGGPRWIRHLSAKLAAKDGQLTAALAWLQIMVHDEKNIVRKQRYQEEISDFKSALLVQTAVEMYYQAYQQYPDTLEQLTPHFLTNIPYTGFQHELRYEANTIKLYNKKTK
ncbi:MAG: hypothetical protein R8K49_07405 [Mariprofundaceae bacterium]